MTTQAKLPESGYFIERVYANRLGLTVLESEKGEEANLFFRWDWKMLADSLFEVNIGLLLEPTRDRNEQVEVSIIGVFRKGSGATEVPLTGFVRYHAPAILMPYVREAVSSLTGRGFYAARHLPAFNVQRLMDTQDPTQATGAKQLQDPLLALPEKSNSPPPKRRRKTESKVVEKPE